MSGILVDTSVWIAYFRVDEYTRSLDEDIDANLICTNELILSELLPLIRLKKENELAEILGTVKKLPLEINWEQIRDYQLINLQNGINKVGIPDLIIYQNAIITGATLLTVDKHFQLMANHISCKVELLC